MTRTRVDWQRSGGECLKGRAEERKGRGELEKRTHTTLFKELSYNKEQNLGESVTSGTNKIKRRLFFLDKISKQTQLQQTHRHRDQTDHCQRGGHLGGWVKEVRGLRSTDWLLQNSPGDGK